MKHFARMEHAPRKNKNNMKSTILDREVTRLLAESQIGVTPGMEQQLAAYLDLIREWNDFAGLVAPGDLACLAEEHLADAVSLAPWVRAYCPPEGTLLDIGSGGGFPAIPLKVLLPALSLVMVERSAKKVGFLRKVIGALRLPCVDLRHGSFPEAVEQMHADVITARAVEKLAHLGKALTSRIAGGTVYLCQSRVNAIPGLEVFHVERVDDLWTTRGLRRGALHLVRRP